MRIYSRAEWGARHDNGVGWAPLPARLYLHHSVTTPPTSTVAAEAAHMRYLESIGEQRFGAGISYTWVAFPSGRVWQGHDVGREGTHTRGHNDDGRGICLIGNYEISVPSAAMIGSVVDLITEARRRGWATGLDVLGHRDVKATACPGLYAYRLLPDINRRAGSGAGGSGGTMSWDERITAVHPDTGAESTTTAGSHLGRMAWRVVDLVRGQRHLRAQVAALNDLVIALHSSDLTAEQVERAAERGARAAMPDWGEVADAVAAAVDHDLDVAAVEAALRNTFGSLDNQEG